jgi:hypothetical protein
MVVYLSKNVRLIGDYLRGSDQEVAIFSVRFAIARFIEPYFKEPLLEYCREDPFGRVCRLFALFSEIPPGEALTD